MTIAQLFVNLGIKGADNTQKALKSTKDGITGIASSSLAAKAAIAAMLYGLERLMSDSAKMGSSLTNFSALTGLSTKQLQQWQYAARQAGVSGEELTGSVKAVQTSMTNMLLGKGAPEGMAMVANKVGLDPKKARDTFYVLEQLQKYAQSVDSDVGNAMLKSFGLSEGVIAAMRRGTFNAKNFAAAPTYSDPEALRLSKIDAAWSNLGQKIQMMVGHLNSKHGLQLITDISKLTNEVLKLADALISVADKFKVFEGVTKVFEMMTFAVESLRNPMKPFMAGAELGGKAGSAARDFLFPPTPNTGGGNTSNQNQTINQTLIFQHDGKDAQRTSDSVKRSTREVLRQMNAQTGGY